MALEIEVMIRTGLLELITEDNIRELEPGEWIWDNAMCKRRDHVRSLSSVEIEEPIGFRQIHILDIEWRYGLRYSKPWMLSDFDAYHGGYKWEIFDYNRFYRIKKEK